METFETSGRRPSVGRELLLMGLLFTCYWQIRHLTKDDTAKALGSAHRVMSACTFATSRTSSTVSSPSPRPASQVLDAAGVPQY